MIYVRSFYNHKRRRSWFNPALRRWYELDGFMMRNSQRHKLVNKVSTIGEISLSDHKPKKLKIELNKPKRRQTTQRKKTPRINFERLRDEETATRYKDRVELLFDELEREAGNQPNDTTN